MSAVNLTIDIEQGSTWLHTLTITDDGLPKDLTGYTARMEIRRTVGGTDAPLVDLPGTDGTINITALAGLITINMPVATTRALLPPSASIIGFQNLGVWSLEITSGSGIVERIAEGVARISAEITR